MIFTILGFFVGILVTMSGIGGAIITTPALILLGVPSIIAVGTDLAFAFITKLIGLTMHIKLHNIRWRLVVWMYLGGVPACLLSLYLINLTCRYSSCLQDIINIMIAGLLLITSLILFLGRTRIEKIMHNFYASSWKQKVLLITVGILVALTITITSVGAGSLTDAFLLLVIPKIPILHVIGTSLAFSTPIALIAGIGHFAMGNVSLELLSQLLLGSIPGACIGAYCIRFTNELLLTKFMAFLFIATASILIVEAL